VARPRSIETRNTDDGALPNLIVIGAMKCGTTALHYYLGVHPQVSMSTPKELNFFVDEYAPDVPDPVWRRHHDPVLERLGNWSKGTHWYRRQFSVAAPVRGESSPSYTGPWFPNVAERMAEVVPDAKIVYLVRDPIERAISHYMHARALGREPRDIADALAHPASAYVAHGRYHARLAPFVERFARERVLVVAQEDLLADRRETMRSVYGFLGVDATFWSPRIERERERTAARGPGFRALQHVRDAVPARLKYRLPRDLAWQAERLLYRRRRREIERPVLPGPLRESLAARFEEETAWLRRLTGRDFANWSV
jgi:hypothetical protein